MTVKSRFREIVMVFEHSWICPYCQFSNVIKIYSPFTQCGIRRCDHCGTEHSIQLDLETKKREMAEKIGNVVLGNLIPGY